MSITITNSKVSYGPNLVTDGLVLYLDAANPDSYPGSGTVWYDLSGNYNSTINGTFEYSGTYITTNDPADYVTIPWGSGIDPYTTQYTVIGWIRANNTIKNQMWFDWGGDGTNQRFYVALNSYGIQDNPWSNSTPDDTQWHMGCIRTGGSTFTYHLDDLLLQQEKTGVSSYTVPDNFEFGTSRSSYYWRGDISVLMIYENKKLTDNEVLQNYEALKSRFGL